MATRPPLTLIRQAEHFLLHRREIYQHINTDSGEIRLMILEPAQSRHDPIYVKLITGSLNREDDHHQDFEAVSYTWGDIDTLQAVFLCGHTYYVTPEQALVLRRLRQTTEPRVLWMDVFCIDQENAIEKEQVIGQMSEIYRKCVRTLIWLGELNESMCEPVSDVAFDAVSHMMEERHVFDKIQASETCREVATVLVSSEYESCICVDANSDPDFDCGPEVVIGIASGLGIAVMLSQETPLSQLPFYDEDEMGQRAVSRMWIQCLYSLCSVFTARWWTRVWVMQEALGSSGSDPIVHIGNLRIPFHTLIRASHAISTALFNPSDEIERVLAWSWTLGIPSLETAIRNVARFHETWNQLHGPTGQNEAIKTLQLLRVTSKLQCTDPRDHIYGVLGLAVQSMQIKVDYSLSTAEVFCRASLRYMRILPKLSYFVYDKVNLEIGPHLEGLPTWACNWAERGNICESVRFHQTHLFSRSEPADWESIRTDSTGSILYLPAFKLDEIAQCFVPSLQPRFEEVGQVIARWFYEFKQTIEARNPNVDIIWLQAVFFTTLLRGKAVEAGHQSSEDDANTGESITVETCKQLLQDTIDIGQKNAGNIGSLLEKSYGNYQRLREAVQYSRMFITKSGCLGIGPSSLTAGENELWHVQGCFAPLALKQSITSMHGHDVEESHHETISFTFIGPCYVFDFMGQRAFTDDLTRHGPFHSGGWETIALR